MAAGALGYAGAMPAVGQAETQYLATAPYQQLLNQLVNEAFYRASNPSYAGTVPGLSGANTPKWLQSVMTNLGVGGGAASGLSVPGVTGVPSPASAAKGGNSSTSSTNTPGSNPGGG